jgi:hypothetical protein
MRTFLLSLVFCASTSAASALTFNFSVNFSTGPLSGDEVIGSFSISGADFTETGVETFSEDGTGTGLLTSFTVFPAPYGPFDLSEASAAPENPTVTFNNGVLFRLKERFIPPGSLMTVFGGLGEIPSG